MHGEHRGSQQTLLSNYNTPRTETPQFKLNDLVPFTTPPWSHVPVSKCSLEITSCVCKSFFFHPKDSLSFRSGNAVNFSIRDRILHCFDCPCSGCLDNIVDTLCKRLNKTSSATVLRRSLSLPVSKDTGKSLRICDLVGLPNLVGVRFLE